MLTFVVTTMAKILTGNWIRAIPVSDDDREISLKQYSPPPAAMCSWAQISYSKRAFSFSKTKTSRLHEICKIFRCVPLSHTPFTKKTKIWQNWFFWIFVPLFNYVNPAFEFFIKSNNFIGLFGLLVFILYSFNTQHQLVVAVWPSRSFKFYERQRGDIRVTIEL